MPYNRSGETLADRQNRFLIGLVEAVSDKEACEAAGIDRSTLYNWIKKDEGGFAVRYDDAVKDRAANLEARMFDVLDWAGKPDQYKLLLSHPQLLMFALKGAYPERYGEKGFVGQEDAKRLLDELAKLKDDPVVKAGEEGQSIDEQLGNIFGDLTG